MSMPRRFPQVNMICPPSGADSIPLPVCEVREAWVSCWQMNWRERISALFFGKVWLAAYKNEKSAMGHPTVGIVVKKCVLKKKQEQEAVRFPIV